MKVNFTSSSNCTVLDTVSDQNLDFFHGVFDNWPFKILCLVTYLLIGFLMALLLFVSYFERSGQAGHYRTLMNKLTSLNIEQMGLVFACPTTIDLMRVFFGPLPQPVCVFQVFVKHVLQKNISLIALSITLAKFYIICMYKAFPVMDDNFLCVFLYTCANLISILSTLVKYYLGGRPNVNEVNML